MRSLRFGSLVLQTALLFSFLGVSQARPEKRDFPWPPYSENNFSPYMVDNTRNTHGVAPDDGIMDGTEKSPAANNSSSTGPSDSSRIAVSAAAGGYWLGDPSTQHGIMPFAPSGYKFFRNVKDYGAKGDGSTDDTDAINKAAGVDERCGRECGSTTTLGALVYFPAGTYIVSRPIIQMYYTQFVGDPTNKPTIKGAKDFKGIALIDTDPYIPGGNGANWYINQNQFFRQIRNFVLDVRDQERTNQDGDQEYNATCLHWQIAQATSLQNIDFKMKEESTDVGIFMENGSGGMVADLTFSGGNTCFRAGSQQFTSRNLVFTNCAVAISGIWNWGMLWKNIRVINSWVGVDAITFGGIDGQGTGSLAIIDSYFDVAWVTTVKKEGEGPVPNLLLENLEIARAESVVQENGGAALLTSGSFKDRWALGNRVDSLTGKVNYVADWVKPNPPKPASLLAPDGKIFERSKPQYEDVSASSVVNVVARGAKNDATGDQTSILNSILASSVGSLVFFPAGIYKVKGTVKIPVGSKIVGEGWSQIMGYGSYFEDEDSPQVVVKVGNDGDKGILEISDMLFTVAGPTAGAVLMEWNVAASTQGSVAMWDSHFRVGGAKGTDLTMNECPKLTGNVNPKCKAASLLFHITKNSNGYFENVWVWTADHDLDVSVGSENTTTASQIDIYSARGMLVESQGPTWLYGSGSEHNVFYQYQFQNAKDLYIGHAQTETPYYQPNPVAPNPFKPGKFPGDPDFKDCRETTCKESYAMRIHNSSDIMVYAAGFYSFFKSYYQDCLANENCQKRLLETNYSKNIAVFNLFTKGAVEAASPLGNIAPVLAEDVQDQFTTEVSVWIPLANEGAENVGGTGQGSGDVYIDPEIWNTPNPTVTCYPPCNFILPPYPIGSTTTIMLPPIVTSLDVAWFTVTDGTTIWSSVVETTTIYPSPVTTDGVGVWHFNWTDPKVTKFTVTESISLPIQTITNDPDPEDDSTSIPTHTRTFTPPPYPYFTSTPTPCGIWCPTTTSGQQSTSYYTEFPPKSTQPTTITIETGTPGPICKSGCGLPCFLFCNPFCLLGCNCATCPKNFPDPENPNPPPPPPGPGPNPSPGGEGPCQPDVKTDNGLCDNGNFPVFNPTTGAVDCDIPNEFLDEAKTECQKEIEEDMEDSLDELNQATGCCDLASGPSSLQTLFSRQTGGGGGSSGGAATCPAVPSFSPQNLPQGKDCHSTFVCDFDKWPNVCQNARSAIQRRGKPSVLTFKAGSEAHFTKPYYDSIWRGSGTDRPKGWGLADCQVEEYPFGSGAPNRNPNLAIWDDQATLRLIPQPENGNHGNALKQFVRKAGNGNSDNADGLIYCVDVSGGGTSTDDTSYLLGDDQSKNICGQAYGVEFILVSKARIKDPAIPGKKETWDPWYDRNNRLYEKTWETVNKNGKREKFSTDIPRQYCKYPSPGYRKWDAGKKEWVLEKAVTNYNKKPLPPDVLDGIELDNNIPPSENKGGKFRFCDDDIPWYTGPKKVRRDGVDEPVEMWLEEPSSDASNITNTDTTVISEPLSTTESSVELKAKAVVVERELLEVNETSENIIPKDSVHAERLPTRRGVSKMSPSSPLSPFSKRQTGGGGSFLDPSAWIYLGCLTDDSYDPCFVDLECSRADGDGEVVDWYDGGDGGGGDPPSDPDPTPTRPDPDLPTVPPEQAPYCFREHIDNYWKPFTAEQGQPVLTALCDTDDYLGVDNTAGFVTSARIRDTGTLITASVSWAKDQTGCKPKKDMPVKAEDWCRDTYNRLIQVCDLFDTETTYGGAFIDNYDYGCVRWWLSGEPSPSEGNTCDCDENSCTPESPACCASGSCTCDCGESGCSPDSPDCCASGSCDFGARVASNMRLVSVSNSTLMVQRLPMTADRLKMLDDYEPAMPRLVRNGSALALTPRKLGFGGKL